MAEADWLALVGHKPGLLPLTEAMAFVARRDRVYGATLVQVVENLDILFMPWPKKGAP